jgi:protein involved in polysaccharide export with SLBB domain
VNAQSTSSQSPNAARPHGSRDRLLRTCVGAVGAAALLQALGCTNVDGWMWDPSIVGRWETTPTVTPVLDRIDIIEAGTGEFIDVTDATAADLIPEPIDYRVQPGDFIAVSIFQFEQAGRTSQYDVRVDNRGFITLPRLDPVQVENMTAEEIRLAVSSGIIEKGILSDPVVTVTIPGQRAATFGIYGAIPNVGRYQVPYPEYRLLDALTDAGGVSPIIPYVFIIRQVSLDDAADPVDPAAGMPGGGGRPSTPTRNGGNGGGTELDQLLEELGEEGDAGGETGNAAFSAGDARRGSAIDRQLRRLMLEVERAGDADGSGIGFDARVNRSAMQDGGAGEAPPIDLEDDGNFRALPGDEPEAPAAAAAQPRGEWVFIDGEWVRIVDVERRPARGDLAEGEDPLAGSTDTPIEELFTERVIRVPVDPLLQGIAKYNVVVRPGDLINVPAPASGVVYVGGPGIARPGTYTLSPQTRLTLLRVIPTAGGLSAIAIPDRVDLTRMLGPNRQATIRLDVAAIAEGTAPDVVLKKDDLINFGTNFWATPLAVIRGGFRASYGFGFLLDRNFGNDVFGAPPSNVGGG